MNLKKKLLTLGLSLAMVLSLAACGQKAAEEEPAEQPTQTEEPETPDFTPAEFKIAALKGPTAMGLVELMSLSDTANEMVEGKGVLTASTSTAPLVLPYSTAARLAGTQAMSRSPLMRAGVTSSAEPAKVKS